MTHREHRRGGSQKAQLPEKLASGEPAGLATNVYPTLRLQKDPLLPLLALTQDSFLSIYLSCLSVQQALSQSWIIEEAAYPSSRA